MRRNKFVYYITLGFILLYTVAAIVVSLNRYWQYQTFYFDFGIFDNAIWKVSRLQPPFVDHVDFGDKNILIFADHFNPSIFLLSPLYWLTSKSEIILIAQSLAVGIAAFVGFLIVRKKIKNQLAQLSLIVAFLGYVGIQNALISDFHDATVAVLPLSLTFWAILNQRWKLYFVFLVSFLGFKESFAGMGVAIGLFLLIGNYKSLKKFTTEIKVGILTIFISFFWGVLAIKFIIPYFSHGIYFYAPKSYPADFKQFLLSFVTPDLHWKTIIYSYLTFGFLPMFDPSIFPAIFENFFERFILSANKGQDLGLHYNAVLSPLFLIGGANVFAFLEKHVHTKKIVTPWAVSIIISVLILHRFTLHGPLGLFYNRVFYEQNKRVTYVDRFLEHVPKKGLIMAQNDLAVRFTHYNVKLFRPDYDRIMPDSVVMNLTPGQNINSFFPMTLRQMETLKNLLLLDHRYSLKKYGEQVYLFTKVEK